MIHCCPAQLNQVFLNIINNAIDALEDYTQTIQSSSSLMTFQPLGLFQPRITLQTQQLNIDQIQVRIRDNGPGIPLEVQSKLFDPFFTTKAVGKGSGLGLSVAYQIIERHHGTIRVASAAGQGTTFIVTLPIQGTTPGTD
ncbi:MAG: hypothetical protein HC825_04440 [Oscillatoriales cyanobacterium RM1_1_9]|nr:hypothetical protein [Oscillatoriales cyanobacterium SM2_3_0]NJO44536.1 hypothetical protein [Oscillatoriales cyanobacterium RM2_1_1]NJO71145.1 hypothetical protein [Oscillatoriales cyanobacterium RM1_1_9]